MTLYERNIVFTRDRAHRQIKKTLYIFKILYDVFIIFYNSFLSPKLKVLYSVICNHFADIVHIRYYEIICMV